MDQLLDNLENVTRSSRSGQQRCATMQFLAGLKSGMTIAPNQIFAHDNPLEPRPVKAALPDSRARTATNNTTKTCADETAGAKQSTSLRPQSCNAPLLRSQTAADCPCWAMVPCHHVAQACAWDEVAHRDTGGVEKSDSAASCKTCGILPCTESVVKYSCFSDRTVALNVDP